jgi:hypothetical protein
VLLTLDEVVQARLGNAHRVGNVAHGGRVVTFDAEEVCSFLEDLGPSLAEMGWARFAGIVSR